MGSVVDAIAVFSEGICEVVPRESLQRLTATEMQSLLCGIDVIDATDIAIHMDITPCTTAKQRQKCEQVREWLIDVLERSDSKARKDFLNFVTGLQRLPLGGAASLSPWIHIHMSPSLPTHNLPVAHTCSNQLEMPLYADSVAFEQKLHLAIRLSAMSGFGVA